MKPESDGSLEKLAEKAQATITNWLQADDDPFTDDEKDKVLEVILSALSEATAALEAELKRCNAPVEDLPSNIEIYWNQFDDVKGWWEWKIDGQTSGPFTCYREAYRDVIGVMEIDRLHKISAALEEKIKQLEKDLDWTRDNATEHCRRADTAEAAVGENCRRIEELESAKATTPTPVLQVSEERNPDSLRLDEIIKRAASRWDGENLAFIVTEKLCKFKTLPQFLEDVRSVIDRKYRIDAVVKESAKAASAKPETLSPQTNVVSTFLGKIHDALTVAFIAGCSCGGKNNPNWRSGHSENCSARYFGKLIEELEAFQVAESRPDSESTAREVPKKEEVVPHDCPQEKESKRLLAEAMGHPGVRDVEEVFSVVHPDTERLNGAVMKIIEAFGVLEGIDRMRLETKELYDDSQSINKARILLDRAILDFRDEGIQSAQGRKLRSIADLTRPSSK